MNSFQLVLASDGSITYVIFIYGDIQWGTRRTTVGFNGGSRLRSYNLPESFSTAAVLNLESTSNVGRPGVYIFRVDQPSIVPVTSIDILCCKNYGLAKNDKTLIAN